MLICRTGYTGELGYELLVHPRDGSALWDALMTAGKPFGLQPMGMLALDRARIEAGLLSAGREFDERLCEANFRISCGEESEKITQALNHLPVQQVWVRQFDWLGSIVLPEADLTLLEAIAAPKPPHRLMNLPKIARFLPESTGFLC